MEVQSKEHIPKHLHWTRKTFLIFEFQLFLMLRKEDIINIEYEPSEPELEFYTEGEADHQRDQEERRNTRAQATTS